MTKLKEFYNRMQDKIASKLTYAQVCLVYGGVLGIFAVSMVIYKKMQADPQTMSLYPVIIAAAICLLFMFFWNGVAVKANANKHLNKVRTVLDDEYKMINASSEDIAELSDMFADYIKDNGITLNARLDEENNICYVLKDKNGGIVSREKKTKRYDKFSTWHVN